MERSCSQRERGMTDHATGTAAELDAERIEESAVMEILQLLGVYYNHSIVS